MCALVGVTVLLTGCGGSSQRPSTPQSVIVKPVHPVGEDAIGTAGEDTIVVESTKRARRSKLTPAEFRKDFAEAFRLMTKYCPSGCTFRAAP
jgi:hypothetical protein